MKPGKIKGIGDLVKTSDAGRRIFEGPPTGSFTVKSGVVVTRQNRANALTDDWHT